MKKIITILFALFLSISLYSQNVVRDGKTFTVVRSTQESTKEKTGFTWIDGKGESHDIYISRRNSCYILKSSKKTGKEYRMYLPKEISQKIAFELGRDKTVDYN